MGVSLVAMTNYHVITNSNATNETYNGVVVNNRGEEFINDGFFGALLLTPPVSTYIFVKRY